MPFPAWFAALVQMPAATPVTVFPDMLQVPGVKLVKVTALPEAPPVALTVPVPPATMLGAAPKLMLWLDWPIVILCVLCTAAA